jgi:receptor protein-tyrosine kinase
MAGSLPSSHLVERAAARLLRSGALDESAADLLQPAPGAAGPKAERPPPLSRHSPGPSTPSPESGPQASDAGPVTTLEAGTLQRAGMMDWSGARSRIAEEFRLIERQLLRAAFPAEGAQPGYSNLLMITSARPEEGKSFTALNLAGSIARQGDHHVLLIDADSKRDSLSAALGLADAPGLLDAAADPGLDVGRCMVKTPVEHLTFLPVGEKRARSAELFSTREMARLIQTLGRRYSDRLLILDAPPCLSTSDPAVLAPVVGQILFVIEAERTQRDEVESALELIEACPAVSLVLNKQQVTSRYTFGAYASYYAS